MDFRAKVTNIKTDKGYNGTEKVKIEFDVENGSDDETLYFSVTLPKHHSMVIEWMQAWQNGQVVSVIIDTNNW